VVLPCLGLCPPAISHLLQLITFNTTASRETFSFARGFSSLVKLHQTTKNPTMAAVTENHHCSPHQVLHLQHGQGGQHFGKKDTSKIQQK